MRKLTAALAIVVAGFGLAGCFGPAGGGGQNGTGFENAVAVHGDALRNAYGRGALPWDNGLHDYAAGIVQQCADNHLGPVNLEACHTGDGLDADLIFWPFSCDQSDLRAALSVNAWQNSPLHLIYLIDIGGWPPGHQIAAASVCNGEGQYIALTIRHY